MKMKMNSASLDRIDLIKYGMNSREHEQKQNNK